MAPRLTTAAIALLGAAVMGAVSTAAALDSTSAAGAIGRLSPVIPGLLSAAGPALLVLSLRIADPRPIGPALALLGAAWLVGVSGADGLRPFTPVAAGWLLAVGEFSYWSLDLGLAGRDAREVALRRGAAVVLLIGASMALATVPELGSFSTPAAGVVLTAAGLVGAAALVAVAAALAWRLRGPADAPAGRDPATRD